MGSLSEVSVTPCDSSPCILYKGENTRVTVKFTTSRRITTGTFLFSGIIDGQEIPFNLTNSYICPYMRPRCPLRANGTVYTFTYSLPVQASYPSITLPVDWKLITNGQTAICARIPISIEWRGQGEDLVA
ncbi:unnamed protein product [Dicrocoelium dendriticum]|nr:unnamed protein product [Dicrocoelium dendriticum]